MEKEENEHKSKSMKMEELNFWGYLKGKLWIILVVNIYVLFFVLPQSLRGVNDFSVSLGAYVGTILINAVWIGIYYFYYKMKVRTLKKLKLQLAESEGKK